MKYNRSPFFYVGDKYKILDQIIPHFPLKINRFFEPFVGGGSVFINVNANEYHLNDIDKYLFHLHNFLYKNLKNFDDFLNSCLDTIKKYNLSRSFREDIVPKTLKLKYKKTYYAKFNKIGYEKMKNDFNRDKSNFLLLYLLVIYGFNRMLRFNKKGDFNLPVGNVDFNKNVFNSLIQYKSFLEKKDKIYFYNLDFLEFLKKMEFEKNDFIYLDPPYLITNSEYNKKWSESDEIRLLNYLDYLDKNNIKFAISNVVKYKENENLYFKHWMKKYNVINIKSNYISYYNNSKKNIKEVLVLNYKNEGI